MSLNKKYTWADFLKDNPEFKKNKTKRTSKEGQKAFEAAFKKHAKEVLKSRLEKLDKDEERTSKKRKALVEEGKKVKCVHEKNRINSSIARASSFLSRIERMREKTKTVQKAI